MLRSPTLLSYLHSSRVHSSVLWESQLQWQGFAFLSFPFCLFLWLHAFICQACVCIPTYVSSSVAKARARDTDGTQMETDNRADQRNAALHTHTLSLAYFLSGSTPLVFLSREPLSLYRSDYVLHSICYPLLCLFSLTFTLSLNSCPVLCSLSQALSLPPSQSLSFGSSSSPVFPHTVFSSVFMGRVCDVTTPTF